MKWVLAQGRGSLGEYEEGLKQALLVQRQLLDGVRGDHPDLVAAHRQAAADMQSELASLYATQHKLDQVRPPCPSVRVCIIIMSVSWGVCICLSVCMSLCVTMCIPQFLSVCIRVCVP